MKNTFKIFLLLISTILIVSCDEDEDIVYFDPINGQTLITFGSSSASLPVPAEGSNTITVPIEVTTISNTERRFSVSVVEEATSAPASTYSLGEVIIPADSHLGTLEVTGVDNDLTDVPVTLTLQIDAGEHLSEGNIAVSLFEFCEVTLEDFVGNYTAIENNGAYGPYDVTIELNEEGDGLILNNFWDYGNPVHLDLDFETFGVTFRDGEYVFTHDTYGDAAVYNLAAYPSSFVACDLSFDLYFRVCVSAGCFTGGFIDGGIENRVQLTRVD